MTTFKLVLGESLKEARLPARAQRRVLRSQPAKQIISPSVVIRALKASDGSKVLLKKIPNLGIANFWVLTSAFSVCQKTGTARYLDIWNAAHFDGRTDMQRNLSECRVWFSANGYTYWDSPETKSGRINCYFRAPAAGNYVCNAQLQSYGGPASVECLIDSRSFGLLPFSGTINQPHPCLLSSGYHSFRIRQVSGSYFFISLTVWRVL